jgi:hypothetical protein
MAKTSRAFGAAAVIAATLAIAAASADAAVSCDVTNGVAMADPLGCMGDVAVPASCPIHIASQHTGGEWTTTVPVYAQRGGTTMQLTGTVAVTPYMPDFGTIDVESCTCDHIGGPSPFDQVTVTVAGAQAGDSLMIVDRVVAIGPAGACPSFDWPTDIVAHPACDLCTSSDSSSGSNSGHAGCATSDVTSPALATLALAFVVMRRRSRARSHA